MLGAKLVLLVLPLACALRAPVAPLRAGLMAPPRPALAMRSSLHMGLSPDESSTKETALDPTCIEDEAVEECQLVSWDAGSITVPMSWVETAKLGVLFTAWFALNVMYNITNKRVQARRSDRWPRSAPARSRAIRSDRPPPQNAFPMPWTMVVVSLFVGIPWVIALWATGIRKAPRIPPRSNAV